MGTMDAERADEQIKRELDELRRRVAELEAADVTQKEQQIPAPESDYFRRLIENLHDLVLIIDADFSIQYVSPSAKRMTGYEPGEVVLAIVRSVATEVCVVELLPGFAVSVAAADVIGTMVVAAWTHAANGVWGANGGYELPLVYATIGAALAFTGAGALRRLHGEGADLATARVERASRLGVDLLAGVLEATGAIPRGLREGSLALGATKLQTLVRLLLPMASPGILTGFILALNCLSCLRMAWSTYGAQERD